MCWTRCVHPQPIPTLLTQMFAVNQMELAFAPGYDPALELANHGKKLPPVALPDELTADPDGPWTQHLRRNEQDLLDNIIRGAETGHYYVVLGPKVHTSLQLQPASLTSARKCRA